MSKVRLMIGCRLCVTEHKGILRLPKELMQVKLDCMHTTNLPQKKRLWLWIVNKAAGLKHGPEEVQTCWRRLLASAADLTLFPSTGEFINLTVMPSVSNSVAASAVRPMIIFKSSILSPYNQHCLWSQVEGLLIVLVEYGYAQNMILANHFARI